jgi:hypothetical protein
MNLERLKQLAGLRRLAAIKRTEDWAARQRAYAKEEEAAAARRAALPPLQKLVWDAWKTSRGLDRDADVPVPYSDN